MLTLEKAKVDAEEKHTNLLSSFDKLKSEFDTLMTENKSNEEKCNAMSQEKDALNEDNLKVWPNLRTHDTRTHDLFLIQEVSYLRGLTV